MLVPKQLGSESATPLDRVIEISEGTVRIGRRYPSDDSETAKVADPASSRFYSGPKFQRERLAWHKFEATLSVRSKVASRYYVCEGRGHIARECPTRLKHEKTRNAPRKGNPSEGSRLRS